jgi:hypothetical protein
VRALLARFFPRLFTIASSPTLSKFKRKQSPAPQQRRPLPNSRWKAQSIHSPSALSSVGASEMTAFSTEVYDGRKFYNTYSASITTVFGESRETLRPAVEEGVIEKCVEINVTVESIDSRRSSMESRRSTITPLGSAPFV